jgi:hypothetical protein
MKHTTLTALPEAGISRDEVQALARHRDPRTTDIFDLDDDQRRRRALASLDRLEERRREHRVGPGYGAKAKRRPWVRARAGERST